MIRQWKAFFIIAQVKKFFVGSPIALPVIPEVKKMALIQIGNEQTYIENRVVRDTSFPKNSALNPNKVIQDLGSRGATRLCFPLSFIPTSMMVYKVQNFVSLSSRIQTGVDLYERVIAGIDLADMEDFAKKAVHTGSRKDYNSMGYKKVFSPLDVIDNVSGSVTFSPEVITHWGIDPSTDIRFRKIPGFSIAHAKPTAGRDFTSEILSSLSLKASTGRFESPNPTVSSKNEIIR